MNVKPGWVGLAVLCACQGGGATSLEPTNTAFDAKSIMVVDTSGVPLLVLFDSADACGQLRQLIPSKAGCEQHIDADQALALTQFWTVGSTRLEVRAAGAENGARLDVIDPDGGDIATAYTSGHVVAAFEYGSPMNGVVSRDWASSGTVEVDAYQSGGSMSGSMDLAFESGAHVAGAFAADYCSAYSELYDALNRSSICASTQTDQECVRDCACGSRSASVSCAYDLVGGSQTWTCTCETPSGKTTCEMSATPDCSSDIGTCCEASL